MACYESDVYKLEKLYVSELETDKWVYVLPDDVDAETAVQKLLMEDIIRQQTKWNEIDAVRLYEYVRSMHFATADVLYEKDGIQYHKWIKNPYEKKYATKVVKNYVDGILNNYLNMQLSVSEMPIMMDAI